MKTQMLVSHPDHQSKPSRRCPQRVKTSAVAVFAAASAVALSILLQGCATSSSTAARARASAEEAIVCPQCKMVAIAIYQPRPFGFYSPARRDYPGWSSYRWAGYAHPQTVYEDQCPGCQGAIVTFFREGKLKHKCSVCSERPFKCPVFHPTT